MRNNFDAKTKQTLARRDNFDPKTRQTLGHRVNFICSNPGCRKPTCAPHKDPTKTVSIGVAAHILAAAPGGKRYNAGMSSQERKSIDNGIWLCQNCAKLIDSDEKKYSADLLHHWKRTAEDAALQGVEKSAASTATVQNEDAELVRFYSQCFDRPAFQVPFYQEGSMEAFDKAIEDTITAINTGALLSAKNGTVLFKSKGKSFISNRQWRERMDVIVDLLHDIREEYSQAIQKGQIHVSSEHQGRRPYYIRDRQVGKLIDDKRSYVIQLFSELCQEADVPTLQFPRQYRRFP